MGSHIGDRRGRQRDTDRPRRARVHQKVRSTATQHPVRVGPPLSNHQSMRAPLHCTVAIAFQGHRYVAIRVGGGGSAGDDVTAGGAVVARGAVAARGLAIRITSEPVPRSAAALVAPHGAKNARVISPTADINITGNEGRGIIGRSLQIGIVRAGW